VATEGEGEDEAPMTDDVALPENQEQKNSSFP